MTEKRINQSLPNNTVCNQQGLAYAGRWFRQDIEMTDKEALSRDGLRPSVLTLEAVRDELGACARCRLKNKRTKLVFGAGNPAAELVFVGEGPGEDEDLQGEPFVGRAGKLLTRIIEAMGLARQDVYICNVVKCRPPGNRNPESDEIAACRPFLEKQIAAIRPKVIVALGSHAAKTLLDTDTGITALRGKFYTYADGIKLMPTFHPSYLLRNESRKKDVWEDMKLVLKTLGLEVPSARK
ncbi:MAG: uracil-DNA glycosylase [Deltaproteobacteria bacterium]|nr:uracil-DNA glycosylase [Deltaproteobacteria bacterium]